MSLQFSDTLNPRPNWLRICVAVAVSLAIAGLLAVAGMFWGGCGSEVPAKTWPEVVDRHWFATGLLISWALLCLMLIAGAIRGRSSDGATS